MVIAGVLLAGAAFILFTSWWADGSLGATDALLLFALYGGLIFGLFAASSFALRALVLVPLVASAGWAALALRKGSLRQYYLEQIRKYQAAIDFDPRNMAARRHLAEALYKIGDIDTAIGELRILIDLASVATEERYLLRQWGEEKRLRETGIAVCSRCGTENERGVNWCRRCEAPLTRYHKKSRLAEAGLKGFMIFFASLTIIVLSFVFLSAAYALIPVGCLLLALAGWRIVAR